MSQSLAGIELHQITGLGRPLNPRVKSNQIAIAGSAAFGVVGSVVALLAGTDSWLWEAAAVAIAAFIGWALGREIDPDHESTAIVSMVIAGVLALIVTPQLLVLAVLLLATRIIAGTVGTDLRGLDLLVVVGASAYAGSQPVAWPIAALLVFAVIRQDSRFATPAAVAMTLATIVSAGVFVDSFSPGVPSLLVWILIAVLGLVGWKRIRVISVQSSADNGNGIAGSGVGLARLATLGAIAAGAILAPDTAIGDLGPAVAAFAAVAFLPRRAPARREVLDEPPALVEAALPPVV